MKCSHALTVIDHFTRFVVLVALQDRKEQTIAKAFAERVFGIFGPPEDKVENKVVKQLQDVFGYKKTKTTPYRPQVNSVSERMRPTLHDMLSVYSNIAHNNWAEVLPFIQLAHNTFFSTIMHETSFFLMFGRQARLPIDTIFGIPHVSRSTTTEKLAHSTRENLQVTFELARRNLSERVDKQKANNSSYNNVLVRLRTAFFLRTGLYVFFPFEPLGGFDPQWLKQKTVSRENVRPISNSIYHFASEHYFVFFNNYCEKYCPQESTLRAF